MTLPFFPDNIQFWYDLLLEPVLPLLDLVRVNIELLRQISPRLIALQRS